MASQQIPTPVEKVCSGSYKTLASSCEMQEMKSLEPASELTSDQDNATPGNCPMNQPKPLLHLSRNANHSRVSYNAMVPAASDDPNPTIPLLRPNHLSATEGRDSATGTTGTSRRNSLPILFSSIGREAGRRQLPQAAQTGDRRNEFFDLKRLIYTTLGMPNTPDIGTHMQRIITCLAIPFYLTLFMWGIAIFVVAVQSDGWIWSQVCPAILPAKVFTMLAGTFYLLLGLFWLLVFWWSRSSRNPHLPQNRNFSTIAFLWWTLCMYYTGVLVALALQVYEHSDLMVRTSQNNSSTRRVYCSEGEELEVPNNIVPLMALGSMLMVWLIYICVLIVVTATTHGGG